MGPSGDGTAQHCPPAPNLSSPLRAWLTAARRNARVPAAVCSPHAAAHLAANWQSAPALPCPMQEEPTLFKVQLKLSCAEGLNDTVALEATAALGPAPDGNLTVSAINWKQIPLPGVGQ